MYILRQLSVVVLLIIVAGLTACGGSDATNPPPPITSVPPEPEPEPEPGVGSCDGSVEMLIVNVIDDGSHDGNGPDNAIDGNLTTRWASIGVGKTISFDLGEEATVREVAVSWYRGDSRVAFFEVQSSLDNSSWATVLSAGNSFMNGGGLETYDVSDSQARYVRVIGGGNSNDAWNSILETKILGCGGSVAPAPPPDSGTGLDPALPPSGNFELLDWNISIPIDTDSNGKADTIKEVDLANGYTNSDYFYTAVDGGMVFKVPVKGPKTSTNTSYVRTELREMLRRGNTSYSTQGVGKNNWVFGSAPEADRTAAGGVDGTLTGTLAVNHVSTTGDANQVGRVIFAQIHANDDEPIRFYYRKLPNNSKGSIYFAHESRNEPDDIYFEMIGSRSQNQANPSDGIALGEKFSYEIKTIGNTLSVKLIRPGKPDLLEIVNMDTSGYDAGGQYMYFKAGAYIQDNTGADNDYAQVTYYELDNVH